MLCPKCGAEVGSDIKLCVNCRTSQRLTSIDESGVYHSPTVKPEPKPSKSATQVDEFFGYAGFWLRTIAWIIDTTIITLFAIAAQSIFKGPAFSLIYSGIGKLISQQLSQFKQTDIETGIMFTIMGGFMAIVISGTMITLLYYVVLEGSRLQATVGKLVVGIYVRPIRGGQMSAFRATVRHLLKFLSALPLFLGYLAVVFTVEKQALHDLGAGTAVAKRRSSSLKRTLLATLTAYLSLVLLSKLYTPSLKDTGKLLPNSRHREILLERLEHKFPKKKFR